MNENLAREAILAIRALAAPEYCLAWTSLCMSRSEWASWVQAVGSIAAILLTAAAIFGSVLAAQIPVRAAREDEHRRRMEGLLKHYSAIDSFARMTSAYCRLHEERLAGLTSAFQTRTYKRRQFFEFGEYMRLFQGIQPVDVPNVTLMKQMGYVASYLGRAERALNDGAIALEDGFSPTPEMWAYLITNVRHARETAEEIREVCRVGVIALVGEEGPAVFLGGSSRISTDAEQSATLATRV